MIHPMIVRRQHLNPGFGVSWRLGSDSCSTVVKRDCSVPSSSILFAHAPFVRTTCVSGWPAYSTVIEQLPPANAGGSDYSYSVCTMHQVCFKKFRLGSLSVLTFLAAGLLFSASAFHEGVHGGGPNGQPNNQPMIAM